MPIFVQSRAEGYWRGGQQHSSDGKEFPDGTFSAKQLEALNEDPDIMMVAETAEELPGGIQTEPVEEIEKESVEPEVAQADANPPEDTQPDGEDGDLGAALIDAAGQAIEDGNTIGSGAPSVEAMEDILGYDITAAQRDLAWEAWKAREGI